MSKFDENTLKNLVSENGIVWVLERLCDIVELDIGISQESFGNLVEVMHQVKADKEGT
jgi:hypothetical protein